MVALLKRSALSTSVVSYLLLAMLYLSGDSQHAIFVLHQHFLFFRGFAEKRVKKGNVQPDLCSKQQERTEVEPNGPFVLC